MSTYWDALTAAKARVLAKPTFAGYSSAQSAIRKRPYCSVEAGDALPFLCFSGEWERLEPEWDHFGEDGGSAGVVGVGYPVVVAWFRARGGEVQDAAAMQAVYQGREEIRNALWQPKALAALQVDAAYDPNPPFDRAGLDALFHLSLQRFVFAYVEER